MNKLDVLTFPLTGQSLIEASAGTGKTYTITHLYLRLLLGHGCEPLSVEQILLVTFTNAATAELKQRIRDKIGQAWLDFYSGQANDPLNQQLIDQIEDKQQACERLALASKQLDEAAIFTIHSFCQRMLLEHAFESGIMYEQSLILDESEYLQQASEDFWRACISPLSEDVLSLLLSHWSSPQHWLASLKPLFYRQAVQLNTTADVQLLVGQYRQKVNQAKTWWLDNQVSQQLLDADLNARNALAKSECHQAMLAFCQSDELEWRYGKNSWAMFSSAAVEKARKKSSHSLEALDFSQFEHLAQLQQECHEAVVCSFNQLALNRIRHNLIQQKLELGLLSPDDLLSQLQKALESEEGARLASAISTQYPVALIDEFQDTDPAQFAIFQAIYPPEQELALVMIGDPKQAIYGFRGADIFTYIQAKQLVKTDQQFTLGTNWRSQYKLVQAVNHVFEQSPYGFMFEQDIPFLAVEAAHQKQQLQTSQNYGSLQFLHLRSELDKPITWTDAQQQMAIQTANQIAHWLRLAQQGQVNIEGKPLQAGDCCVLVRDRNEADIIKQALSKLNIASVFLIRKSVFATESAYQLYLLLQALLHAGNERLVKGALLTELFSFDALEFEALLADELGWQQLLECFHQWRLVWQRKGLMSALNQVFRHFSVFSRQVELYEDGLRRVTDLRHLMELLQQQSTQVQGQAQLLRWLQDKVAEPDDNMEGQQLRLETDAHLVQIVTIHASKGLEYPMVFMPFASRFRPQKQALFHDEQQRLVVDLLAEENHLSKADRERLAEDIRLFYVAVTRAIHFCAIGVWNNAGSTRKKDSELLHTALGKLLFKEDECVDDEAIRTKLALLAEQQDIRVLEFTRAELAQPLAKTKDAELQLRALSLTSGIDTHWQLTSYSAISRLQQHESPNQALPGYDEGASVITAAETEQSEQTSAHNFIKGAKAGSFLHGVLENIDFQQPQQLADAIEQQGQWYGIDQKWWPMLEDWLAEVLISPLGLDGLQLANLRPGQIKVEMEFYLPLKQVLVQDFNRILALHNPQQSYHYQFGELNGMLKGFIDLTFEYQGKFYLADYKSNYLGPDASFYQGANMHEVMLQHDYLLQAILYAVALHRWLKLKLPDYDYQRHIGGAYYLFLRGMQHVPEYQGQGVYFYQPPQALIEDLDLLFSGRYLPPEKATTDGEQLSLW